MDFDWLGLAASVAVNSLIPLDAKFEFDRTTNIARFGGEIVHASLINDARLEVEFTLRSRNLAVVFGVRGVSRLVLPLRKGDTDLLSDNVRDRVIAMLEVSTIEIPFDKKYDPKGKFARSGSPTHLTRAEAIELVRNPPMPGEPLPINWP